MELRTARRIMGTKGFLGPEVAHRFAPSPVRTVPFSEAELRAHRKTHGDKLLLAFVPQISASRLRAVFPDLFLSWGNDIPFPLLHERSWPRWHLLRKNVVPGSLEKSLDDQLPLLREYEQVPDFPVLAYVVAAQYIAHRELLFDRQMARCRSANFSIDKGKGPYVEMSEAGLTVGLISELAPGANIGLAAEIVPGIETVETRLPFSLPWQSDAAQLTAVAAA